MQSLPYETYSFMEKKKEHLLGVQQNCSLGFKLHNRYIRNGQKPAKGNLDMKWFLAWRWQDEQESGDSWVKESHRDKHSPVLLSGLALMGSCFWLEAFCTKLLNHSIALITCQPSKFLAFATPVGIYSEEGQAPVWPLHQTVDLNKN